MDLLRIVLLELI